MRTTFAAALTALALAAWPAQPAGSAPLAMYEGEAWPLIVFGPSGEDAEFSHQRSLVSREFGTVHEHEITVLLVVGDDPVVAMIGEAPRTQNANAVLRQAFRAPEDAFRVVLLDLEGQPVRSWDDPVDLNEIVSLVTELPGSATLTDDTDAN